MNTILCPTCGASLLAGSETCSACKVDIDWQGSQPAVTTAGRAFQRVMIVLFIELLAAGAVLAATLLVISDT